MNILFDIGHPAHVHMFKYSIFKLKEKGHNVLVTVKNIPSAIQLLKLFNIKFISIGKKYDSIFLKGLNQFKYDWNLFKIANKYKIDLAIGSSISITHVSCFHKMKSIIMDDDDDDAVQLFVKFAHPFADFILSPDALVHQRNGKKDITYAGTHEMMYLHSELFEPNKTIINEVGLKEGDSYFVLRFVAAKAYHDISQNGLTLQQKRKIIDIIKPHGKVFITTEREVEPEFMEYQLDISPEKIHHLLYFADMFIGDSQTMTSEAAILGTPALKCNTFAGKLSIPNELEKKYDLCYSFQPCDFKKLIEKMEYLVSMKDKKIKWRNKVNKLYKDKINVSRFLVWLIENFPKSVYILKENPEYQLNFRSHILL